MKIKQLIFFIIFTVVSLFAYTNEKKVVYYTLTPRNWNPLYIRECLFYDDGFIKEINDYDIKEPIDLYQWDKLKTKAKKNKSYFIERLENKITVYLVEGDKKTVSHEYIRESKNIYVRSIFIEWPVFQNKQFDVGLNIFAYTEREYVDRGETTSWVLDDRLARAVRNLSGSNKPSRDFLVSFDGKHIYEIIYKNELEDFPFEHKMVAYVSDYLSFSRETAYFNRDIIGSEYHTVFFALPTIQKKEYVYRNKEKELLVTNQSLVFSNDKNTTRFSLEPKKEAYGLSYVYDKNIKKGLLLKNGRFSIYYDDTQTKPAFMGFDDDALHTDFIQPKIITSSSFLTEPTIVYEPENLLSLELKKPWVEGVKGQGIGEYIEFDTNGASGMYLINGYVSMDRPDLYEKNSRVKLLSAESTDGKIQEEVFLFDTAKPQFIDLSHFEKETVRLVIKEVYPGILYDDTCIAGIVLVR